MSENLRDRYAEVMDKHRPVQSARLVVDCLCGWMADKRRPDHFAEHLRDELLAARDDVLAAHQEQIETYYRASQEWLRIEAEQKAEIERWRGEYGKQHDRADRIQSNTAALYGRAHDAEARAHIAEAEVARLRETVDRVEARVAAWEDPDWGGHLSAAAFARAIRAALAPRPSASEAPRCDPQRDLLANALARLLAVVGVDVDQPLTGPQLLVLADGVCEELAGVDVPALLSDARTTQADHTDHTDGHECVFVEEREPSGRLILGPCLVCGTTALDALEHLRDNKRRSA